MKNLFDIGAMVCWLSILMLCLFLFCEAVEAQPTDPDTPFVPYVEPWEAPATPYFVKEGEEDEIEHDYELYDRDCPVLHLQGELIFFQAECDDVYMDEKIIIVPAGCRYTFQVAERQKGRIVQMLCPTLFILYKDDRGV